jgi:hypothetical protein
MAWIKPEKVVLSHETDYLTFGPYSRSSSTRPVLAHTLTRYRKRSCVPGINAMWMPKMLGAAKSVAQYDVTCAIQKPTSRRHNL